MKFITTLATLAAAATPTLLTTPAFAQPDDLDGWTNTGEDDIGNVTYLRDEDWLKGRSHHRAARVWVRVFFSDAFKNQDDRMKDVAEMRSYYEFDCTGDTFRTLKTSFYMKDFSSIDTGEDGSREFVIPGSNVDSIRRYVCSEPE